METTLLKRLRIKRGLRLVDVAEAVGTNNGNLSRIENGYQIPQLSLAKKLAEFFNVSPMAILYPSNNKDE